MSDSSVRDRRASSISSTLRAKRWETRSERRPDVETSLQTLAAPSVVQTSAACSRIRSMRRTLFELTVKAGQVWNGVAPPDDICPSRTPCPRRSPIWQRARSVFVYEERVGYRPCAFEDVGVLRQIGQTTGNWTDPRAAQMPERCCHRNQAASGSPGSPVLRDRRGQPVHARDITQTVALGGWTSYAPGRPTVVVLRSSPSGKTQSSDRPRAVNR
jgi:hypothetical protein